MPIAHDDIWSALANPLRRRILDVLSQGPAGTGAVVAALDADRHVVMAHLRVLREVDLVRVEPHGRERLNHLNPVPLQDVVGRWISRYEQDWAAALIGLRDSLETPTAAWASPPISAETASTATTSPPRVRRARGA